MQVSAGKQDNGSPESLIGRVAHQLRNQALWDSLLIFSPPLLAILYLIGFLYRFAWIPVPAVALLIVAAITAALFLIVLRFRSLIPSTSSVARLLDTKAQAKDRFITVATLDPTSSSEVLLNRLRQEATGLLSRVEIRREFPYRIKRSFLWSAAGSVFAIILFHLFLIGTELIRPAVSPQQRIRALAEQMAQRPPLKEIARALQSLATSLEDRQVPHQDKQSLIQETQKQIEEQQKKEEQQNNKDLLSDASSTLKSLEQESGGQKEQAKEKEGGGVQSNASQEGQGEAKQSQGSGNDSKGELSAQLSKDTKDGKSTQGDPQGQGPQQNRPEKNQQKANQPDPSNPDKTDSKESAAKTEGGSDSKLGKNRSDEMPKDGPPADRYYQPGEQGKDGIKGARYVTVQLPEEIAGDSSGVTTTSKVGKETRNRPKLPVSNVPLPAHVPDAPAEKQRMPLEYRDLIR